MKQDTRITLQVGAIMVVTLAVSILLVLGLDAAVDWLRS